MLRVIQTKSAEGAKSYYSQSDYLSEGQELVGRWGGKASHLLGLSGEVDKQSFDRLCENLDPRTGERLTLRTNAERTVGYDFNFHVPKGVSLAYTLNHDDRILSAFRESVEETMQEIEADGREKVSGTDTLSVPDTFSPSACQSAGGFVLSSVVTPPSPEEGELDGWSMRSATC